MRASIAASAVPCRWCARPRSSHAAASASDRGLRSNELTAAESSSISPLRRPLEWAANAAAHGVLNFLLSNGECLFAHCSDRLWYIVRKAPFTTAHLVDEDVAVDFSQVTTPDDRVAVIATLPLTDNETWTALDPGELAVFQNGERLSTTDLVSR